MTPDSLKEFFAASAGVAGALIGLLFVAASLLSLRRARRVQAIAVRDALFLFGQFITFGAQLWLALRLTSDGHDSGAAEGIAIEVVVCFLLGIHRSWELIGGPSIGLGGEVTALVRERVVENDRPGEPD